MRILFLSRRFYPDIGGVEKHVFEVGKKLIKKGHGVTVVTQCLGQKTEIDGISIIRINNVPKGGSEKLHIWNWLFANRKLIKDSDVIHAHDVYFWYFPFRFLYPFKKSFVTFHGYESYPIKKRAIFIRRISEKLSNGNIIVGDFIRKWYGTKPDFVTYGGVEISNIKYPANPAGRQISNKQKRESAVFIGRLDEQTGILDYAKAIELIRKDYPKFKFTIIGDGKYKDKLKKYKVLGFKANPEKYFEKHSFAFVSRYLSILEALANKRLVFAIYDNPVKEDYLKMSPFAPFIFIEDSSEKLADKVKYCLTHEKECADLIERGYGWVKNQTWENVVNAYLSLWEKH